MSCDYPIKCRYFKKGYCSLSKEEFEKMCKEGNNPCELHEEAIEQECLKDAQEAFQRGDSEEAEYILFKSPFSPFRRYN